MLFEHPALLLAFYDPIFHAGKDARLLNWQVKISKDFAERGNAESRHLLVTAPNGSGKSSVIMSAPAVWTAVGFKESLTVVTSSSVPQLDSQTMPAVKRLAGQMNEYHREDLWEIQHRYLRFKPNNSEIIARKSDEEGTMEGFHPKIPGGEFTILVDEGKSIPAPVYNGILKWTGATRRIDVTSAGEPTGYYYQMWTDPDLLVSRWLITDEDCPHMKESDRQKVIAAAGGIDAPLAQQILKSRFVSVAGDVVVTLEAVEKCLRLGKAGGITWHSEEMNRAGIDLSGGGDESIVSVWNGNKQMAIERVAVMDTLKQEDYIAEVLIPKHNLKMERIWADAGGLGKPMIRHIEEKVMKKFGSKYGQRINMVWNNLAPIGTLKKNFGSRGTEMWFQFGLMIQQCQIILLDDEKQTQQLANRRIVQAMSSDKLVLEPKPKARSEGRGSPDRADSAVLALCRYEPQAAVADAEYKAAASTNKRFMTPVELEQWMDDLADGKFASAKPNGKMTVEHLTGLRQKRTSMSDLMRRK